MAPSHTRTGGMVLPGSLARHLLTAFFGLVTMKTLHIVTALAFASFTVSAFAGPDWDAIQRARQASHQQSSVTHTAGADQRSMEEACQEMMKQMPMGQLHQRPGGPLRRAAPDGPPTRTGGGKSGGKTGPGEAGESVRFAFGPTSATWAFASRPSFTAVNLGLLFPDISAARGVWAYPNGSRLYSGH